MPFLKSIKLAGFLSFPPDCAAIELEPLNVLIGPNASGKSNLLEAIEILRATPTSLAPVIRAGGGAAEWLWKGLPVANRASLEFVAKPRQMIDAIRYRLAFSSTGQRTEIVEEVAEAADARQGGGPEADFFYRFQHGQAVFNMTQPTTTTTPPPNRFIPSTTTLPPDPCAQPTTTTTGYWAGEPIANVRASVIAPRVFRTLDRSNLAAEESVLSQFKDPEAYPELHALGHEFSRMQSFRNWTFGSNAPLRRPQRTDLPSDELLAASDNLGLILNELSHSNALVEFNRLFSRFLPRYQRFSTRIQANTVQLYLHENGLTSPVPATRLSDGTIRFMTILALLLSPAPPPLLCIEEPELGLHPDAVSLLAELLVAASARSQLIVTTHSDALVSALSENASSVMVCEYRGGTVFERVDPDKLQHWLEKYRLGEIWRIGELGGNP